MGPLRYPFPNQFPDPFRERPFRDQQEKQLGPQLGGPSALSPGNRGFSHTSPFPLRLFHLDFSTWTFPLGLRAYRLQRNRAAHEIWKRAEPLTIHHKTRIELV